MSKKKNRRQVQPMSPEQQVEQQELETGHPDDVELVPDAAAVVADAQPVTPVMPDESTVTPEATSEAADAQPVTRAYVKSLRALSVKAVKAGDKGTADTLTAAANLAEQQVEQQEQECKAKTAHSSALVTFLQKTLPIYYAGDISDRERIAKAFGLAVEELPDAPPTTPFTARFGPEPPFVENASRGRKQGDTAPPPRINAAALGAAGVETFLLPDGSEIPPVLRHGTPVKAHPCAYLYAIGVCNYDSDCANAEHIAAYKRGDKEIAGRTFTDAQRQKSAEVGGLRHGTKASCELVSHGATDAVRSVRMTDGSIQPVKDIVAKILATAS